MYTQLDAEFALQHIYGLKGELTRLPGEYDANFLAETGPATKFILKISHPQESLPIIEMQNAVLHWLEQAAPSLRFPTLRQTIHMEWVGRLENNNNVRLFTFIPGQLLGEVAEHTPGLLESVGKQLGHLTKALCQFKHHAASRYLKWDLKNAAWIREQLQHIDAADDKACVSYFLEIFETRTSKTLATLRQSVIHGDINDYNILVASENTVTGVIDFGDLVETATICELAIALTYVMLNKSDPITVATTVIKNYHAVFPLEESEIDILLELICIRLCVSVVNSAMRKKENPHDAYLTISEKPAWQLLRTLRTMDAISVTNLFREVCGTMHWTKAKIKAIREKHTGKNLSLSYQQPLQIVRGIGQYLYDESGREYLDCINNVAHVGHCHPKVVAAGQKQMAILNTNTRYLDENLARYAERLLATLPAPLEVCYFVCSGSEANELALRLAQTHTQRNRILVMDHAYHGNTTTLINISPYKFNGAGGMGKPDFVDVLPIPTTHDPLPTLRLNTALAAFISESLLSCGGQIVLPAGYLQHVYAAVREKGGVCIADEIQVGLGRVGAYFWGFETQGVIPDIVTLGKPLGNGYPLAAVITTREIADSFNNGMEYFSSFGGTPVACAIGLAVLAVLEEENLQAHALKTGDYLKQKLTNLMSTHTRIKEVRGHGLFLGIELNENRDFAKTLINQMQQRGILLSTDGPLQNVIKIKPPMVFNQENCDVLTANLAALL